MTRALVLAALAALAFAVAALPSGSSAAGQAPARAADEAVLAKSHELAVAPERDRFVADGVPATAARVVAGTLASRVPLPAGGTFSGIQWERAGGEFTHAEIASVLEYNAVCQWLRAWRDGRNVNVAVQVIAEAANWPAWRDTESGRVLEQVGDEVARARGSLLAGVITDCDAAHAREVEYAETLGLSPTR